MEVMILDKPDTQIRQEGMQILLDKLGKVDAERFVAMISREPFDYTEWQQNLFEDMSTEELLEKVKEYEEMEMRVKSVE